MFNFFGSCFVIMRTPNKTIVTFKHMPNQHIMGLSYLKYIAKETFEKLKQKEKKLKEDKKNNKDK